MEENLLLHILTAEATSEEKDEFYRRLENNKEEQELFYEVKSLWLRASMKRTVADADAEFENLWRELKHREKETTLSVGRRILVCGRCTSCPWFWIYRWLFYVTK